MIKKSGSFEIRIYPKMLVANIKIEGQRDEALRKYFPFLSKIRSGKQRRGPKISMAVPVMQTNAGSKNYSSVYFLCRASILLNLFLSHKLMA